MDYKFKSSSQLQKKKSKVWLNLYSSKLFCIISNQFHIDGFVMQKTFTIISRFFCKTVCFWSDLRCFVYGAQMPLKTILVNVVFLKTITQKGKLINIFDRKFLYNNKTLKLKAKQQMILCFFQNVTNLRQLDWMILSKDDNFIF